MGVGIVLDVTVGMDLGGGDGVSVGTGVMVGARAWSTVVDGFGVGCASETFVETGSEVTVDAGASEQANPTKASTRARARDLINIIRSVLECRLGIGSGHHQQGPWTLSRRAQESNPVQGADSPSPRIQG